MNRSLLYKKFTCFGTESSVSIHVLSFDNLMSVTAPSIQFFGLRDFNVLEEGVASMMVFYS